MRAKRTPPTAAVRALAAPLNEVKDRYFMYVGGAKGYTDYPALAVR